MLFGPLERDGVLGLTTLCVPLERDGALGLIEFCDPPEREGVLGLIILFEPLDRGALQLELLLVLERLGEFQVELPERLLGRVEKLGEEFPLDRSGKFPIELLLFPSIVERVELSSKLRLRFSFNIELRLSDGLSIGFSLGNVLEKELVILSDALLGLLFPPLPFPLLP